ncbi:AbrB/MazE/SpoVT family DNA-binding domain-containing protein [Candidatus Sumerlaeota bacterium]|nr:AbrB/MazE/SpoVT family DNA-binding domain-containing protein [Candidatus Sumerlaeota bacterium]
MTSTVSSKGQVTLPAEARRKLGIRAGTRLEFVIHGDDRMEIIRVDGSVRDLKGMLAKPKRPLTLAQMDEAISGGAGATAHKSRRKTGRISAK